MPDGGIEYAAAWRDGLRPPAMMTVSEWADAYRILSRKGSSQPGEWRTARTPYLREPMDCLTPSSPWRRVVLMFGSQMGKTEVVLNWLGAVIHLWPGPTLLVQPTLDMAKRLNRQRLDPMLAETPVLRDLVASPRSRDSGNTMFLKEFRGGLFVLTGANSGSALQSMPAAYLAADEVSSYPLEADDKGDPLENAEARTSTFPMGKVLITSTPGTRGMCRITSEFEKRSDCRRLAVPMPCCGSLEVLTWQNMTWDRPDGEVWATCPSCGERVGEHHKTAMLAGAIWRPTATGDGITAGFHLPGWYAPAGWHSWGMIRDEFLRAKDDALLLKGWINKRAAEAWEDLAAAAVSASSLMERAQSSTYEAGTCPDGVLVLLMAVDVQDTWLETTVWGMGRSDRMWRIWHEKIEGDPAGQHIWQQIDTIREREWPHVCGASLKVKLCAVDTGGHYSHEVYEYCRQRSRLGVVAIKGSSTRSSPALSKGKAVDVRVNGKVIKNGVKLYQIGVHALKQTIYGRLKRDDLILFDSSVTEEYLRGLTCERLIPRNVKGFQVLTWEKPAGARNEPLDLAVYAIALLELIARRYSKTAMWSQLEAELIRLKRTPDPLPPEKPSGTAPLESRQPRRRGGFVTNW